MEYNLYSFIAVLTLYEISLINSTLFLYSKLHVSRGMYLLN